MKSLASSDLASDTAAVTAAALAAHYGFHSVPFAAMSQPASSNALPDARQLSGEIATTLQRNRAITVVEVAGGVESETVIGGVAAALERSRLIRITAEVAEPYDALLLRCCRVLGIEVPTAERTSLERLLLDDLLKNRGGSEVALLIIEHAERVAPDSLRKLHMLTELGTRRFLQVLLVSEPGFDKLLENPNLVLLRDALGTIYRPAGTDVARIQSFIEEQLQAAGSARFDLFEAAAVARLADYARGDLEIVVRLCRQALLIAQLQSVYTVGIEVVEQAALVVSLQSSVAAPAAAEDALASLSKPPSSTANDQRVDSPGSDLPAGFVASQRSPAEKQAFVHPSALIAAAAPAPSTLPAVNPPPAAGSDRIPMILGAIALAAAVLAGAGWAAYREVEAVLARSHARGPAHLAFGSETFRPVEPSREVPTEARPQQPAPAPAAFAPQSEPALASLVAAVESVEPAAAAVPQDLPAAGYAKPQAGAVSILNSEPISLAALTSPAPAEPMSMAESPEPAQSTLSATAAVEASPVGSERARFSGRGEPSSTNRAHLSSMRPAPTFMDRVAEAPITRADETPPAIEARSFAAAPAANATEAAADAKVQSGSSLRPDVPGETSAAVPIDRSPRDIEVQANAPEVKALSPVAPEAAVTVSSVGTKGPNVPLLIPLPFAGLPAQSAETAAVDFSTVGLTDELQMAISSRWPDGAAARTSAAELGAEPARDATDPPKLQRNTQSERATIKLAGQSDIGSAETSAAPPANQETARAAGPADVRAAVVPSTLLAPAVPLGINTSAYAAGTSVPTRTEVSSLASPERGRVSPSALVSTSAPVPSSQRSVDPAGVSSSSTPTEAEALMLSRGEAHLKSGDFAAARVFFQRAGKNQFAALGLAKSYDPLYFAETRIVGARGDRKLALKWYREAAVSAQEAAERLRKLEAAPE